MRVENIMGKDRVRIINHFVLRNVSFNGISGNAFQAGTNIVAFKPYDRDIKVMIDRNHGMGNNASNKYRNIFLGISNGEYLRGVEANEYKAVDLNEYEWV